MTTETRPDPDPSLGARSIYGVLLVLAVIAVLIVAAKYAFPSGIGIHREPAETAPASQDTPR